MPMPEKITVLRFQLNYDDGSGPRTAVSYDSQYKHLDGSKFVKIEAVGGDVLVHLEDLQFLRDALDKIEETL